jgi:uncharacterized protein (TIGR01777 family)
MNNTRVVIAGGNGFIGRFLTRALNAHGLQTVVLTRRPRPELSPASSQVEWDGKNLGNWAQHLEGAFAVINLAGRSVNCRYTRPNQRDIYDSRVDSTRVLGESIRRCEHPPEIWINSSTATIYQHSLEQPRDENSTAFAATPEAKDAFSVHVAEQWERTCIEAVTPATRKILLRAGMVLSPERGGVFHVLSRLVRFRLGGPMAGGSQYVSWIHAHDFSEAVKFLLAKSDLSGPINVTSPNPIRNREMMQALREAFGVRLGLPASRWMLELGTFFLRTETELILKSRCVVPARLLQAGFAFRFPTFKSAVDALLAKASP